MEDRRERFTFRISYLLDVQAPVLGTSVHRLDCSGNLIYANSEASVKVAQVLEPVFQGLL